MFDPVLEYSDLSRLRDPVERRNQLEAKLGNSAANLLATGERLVEIRSLAEANGDAALADEADDALVEVRDSLAVLQGAADDEGIEL